MPLDVSSLSRIVADLEALLERIDDLQADVAPAVQTVLIDALCHLQLGLDTIRSG